MAVSCAVRKMEGGKNSRHSVISFKECKHVQIEVPATLQGRQYHSATAISLSPGLEEVILFGGRTDDGCIPKIANTIVLRFGQSCEQHKQQISVSVSMHSNP